MTKQDLSDLLVRVEGASGGSKALSNAVCIATGVAWTEKRNDPGFVGEYMRGWYPNVTGSLDAALALVTRVLPDAYRDLGEGYDTKAERRYWIATLTYHTHGKGSHSAEACSASLALLAAMLKALQETDNQT